MFIFGNIITRIIAIVALTLAVIAIIISCINNKAPQIEGIQAELIGAGGGIIPNGGNVIFDRILNDQSESISYNFATGEFTITECGTYNVAWWTAPDGAGPAINVSFAVAVNGVPYSTASSPIVSVQMAASALVTVNTVPVTISLINVTGDDVFVPSTPVQAGIVITK
jgi:hypothetical protein